MIKTVIYGLVLLLALGAVLAPCASAQLVGTAFGFPTILQTGSTTAFNQDTAAATDNEAVSINFASGFFPTISQTVDQTQTLTHTAFAQTTETAAFSYPFVGVGGAAIPGFGFGF